MHFMEINEWEKKRITYTINEKKIQFAEKKFWIECNNDWIELVFRFRKGNS